MAAIPKTFTMGERTKVSRANTSSPSVRTTIPEGIVKDLQLKVGDTIVWYSYIVDGKVKVEVQKEA